VPGAPGATTGGTGRPSAPGIPGAGNPATQPGQANAPHWRTEFVIFFIWKEWTPSDDLRGQGAAAENKTP
jgi:hypothetical protein